MKFTLYWSWWELGFVTASHLAATLSVLYSELLPGLMLVFLSGVGWSYLYYLRERISTYFHFPQASLQTRDVQMILSEQGAALDYRGSLWETQLPSVSYFSEFLLVLRFSRALAIDGEIATAKAIHLALWPDSLSEGERRRLRRYLRFDLPTSLSEH